MTTVDLNDTANLLRARRQALLDQLDAVDTALAALTAAGIVTANAQEPPTVETMKAPPNPTVPTRVKPARVLSDVHRHALKEGGRKARHSKDVVAGRARETRDRANGLAATATTTGPPRLVKRQPLALKRFDARRSG